MTKLVPKSITSVVTTKENVQQSLRDSFANKCTINKRDFGRGKIPQFSPNNKCLGYQDQNETGNSSQNCDRNQNSGNHY